MDVPVGSRAGGAGISDGRALLSPTALTPPPAVVETHSAWVVFLGDRAFKVKKPVSLGFLDFSTREHRRSALHEELELNRRLAPDVYLGVGDVVGDDGTPCEHVLVMRRLPDDQKLSALVERGGASAGDVRAIAKVVAAFHAATLTSPDIDAAGAPERIRAKVERDLDELDEHAPGVLDATALVEARRLATRYLDGRDALLRQRVASGCIRDGHGDLLADDVFCLPDGPRVLDCIEFDAGLRHCDVLADIAFLVMDLEWLGAPELAEQLLVGYGEFSGEHHPDSLAHYYVATRALVRAKVAAVRVDQGDLDRRDAATKLLALALRHFRAAQVRLVLVGGAPGTGKSTVAKGLAAHFGWMVLRTDEVRKDVAGVGRASRSADAFDRGIYTSETTGRTYAELLDRAELALRAGESVILDATWAEAAHRASAARLADDVAASLVEIRCDAAPEVAAARIERRRGSESDVSDADPEIARAIRSRFDPWPTATTLSTDRPRDDVLRAATDHVARVS